MAFEDGIFVNGGASFDVGLAFASSDADRPLDICGSFDDTA